MLDETFRERPKNLCRLPKWGHGKVKRLLGSGAGIIFKGSGFYSTDYRSPAYKEAAKKEAPSTATGSPGEKSETKSAGKAGAGEKKPSGASEKGTKQSAA